MTNDTAALAAKSAATGITGITVAFGLTWWAVAAAVVGAFASLHFEKEAAPSTMAKLLGKIASLAFLAALLAATSPHLAGFAWTENVPVAVRAGLLGVLANPIYELLRLLVVWFGGRFKAAGG